MIALACDNRAVAGAFDIEVLRRKLRAAMARREIAPTTLSTRVGKSPTLVKDLLEKTGDTKISTIYRLADALGVDVGDLLDGDVEGTPLGPRLYVKGEVAAGQWIEAFEWPEQDWLAMTGRPDVNADPKQRFFLRVRGDSMNLVYPEGSYIECVSVFGHAEALPGKRVVVLRRRVDGLIEATVKELVETNGEVWFAPRSTNPAHQAFRGDNPGEEIEEVSVVAVVVASVRPE